MILIRNGRVIDPSSALDETMDLVIDKGRIEAMGIYETSSAYDRVIDARGMIVAPGFVDIHVHFRDPGFTYKEDLVSGARAAARGGFTHVVCMANTNPIMDDPALLGLMRKRIEDLPIHVYFASAVSEGFRGKKLVDMAAMKKAGAVCFSDDGLPLQEEAFVREAMRQARDLDMVLSFHEEDPAYIKQAGIHHGRISRQMGLYGADREAELSMVRRDIALAKETKAAIHVQHISSKEAVMMIAQAQKEGIDVSAEASPHHFSLNETAVLKHGTLAKMNPPLREEEDRLAIIKGLQENVITIIATDHAPHAKEEKEREFVKAPSGIIGLETSLSLGITHLVKTGYLSISQLIDKMSCQPARRLQLKVPQIKIGCMADLVIFDEQEQWTVGSFASKSCNSPFVKETLYGKIKYTICNGAIVYLDHEIHPVI